MKVSKPLYGILETDAYWFNCYYIHQINKLFMIKSIYSFCLLYTNDNDKSFGIASSEQNNLLILTNDILSFAKEKKLKKIKLLAKNREKLIPNTSIKFNRNYIRLVDDNSFFSS